MGMTWQEANGDETYALDWPLDENSHVWEIGGFEGRWAQQIWDKFHCNITIFEPQLWAVEKMKKRFDGIEKIEIRPYGLWTEEVLLPMGNYHTDGASLIKDDGREEKRLGYFKDYRHEIQGFPHTINLALMNIEGAEYRLMFEFSQSKLIQKFDNIWVQFHPFDESDDTHKMIFKEIEKTHLMLWDFFPTAVAWRKR